MVRDVRCCYLTPFKFSPAFVRFFWALAVPGALIILLYPPKIHGYLNPYDDGLWLGLAQGLIDGKKAYRDVFFHYGPAFPAILKWALSIGTPTVALVREVAWGL